MKKTIRLNESEFRQLVSEAVKNILFEADGPDDNMLTELDWKTYANASRKWANHLMKHPDDKRRKSSITGHEKSTDTHDIHTDNRLRGFNDAMRKNFNKEYGFHSYDSGRVRDENGFYEMPWESDNIGKQGYYYHISSSTETQKPKNGIEHRIQDEFDLPTIDNGNTSSEPHRIYNLKGAFDKERRYDDRKPVEPEYDDYPYMKARNKGNQEIQDYRDENYRYIKGKGWVIRRPHIITIK